MARIRTIKPDFFKHEELLSAETESGLPLRLGFIGLWTVADRAGRFKWRPRAIKVEVFPYEDVDFSRVLDALATRGFIKHYACETGEYGVIPSWEKHQHINNREIKSELPDISTGKEIIHASNTRQTRVKVASTTRHEGKGKEGKGKEDSSSVVSQSSTALALTDSPKVPSRKVELPSDMMQTYHAAKTAFEESEKAKAIIYQDPGSTARELKSLKLIVRRAHKLCPDAPEPFLAAVMQRYRELVNGKLKGKVSWTPSGLVTTWIWNLVLEGMQTTPTEEEAAIIESVAGLFAKKKS